MNLEVLDRALASLKAGETIHDQKIWLARSDCGTACCLAGQIVLDAGLQPCWEPYHNRNSCGYFSIAAAVWTADRTGRMGVEAVAATELGLDVNDAYVLFETSNSYDDLLAMRNAYADGGWDALLQYHADHYRGLDDDA